MAKKLPEILTRCGYRCDLCLAYKDNIKINDRREELSDGWLKVFGVRIPAVDIYCDGCLSDDRTNPRLIHKRCFVRSCTKEKELENCSQCKDYVCDELKKFIVNFEDVQKKTNNAMTRPDRTNFIRAYENKERLDNIRKSINGSKSRLFNKFIIPDEKSMIEFICTDMKQIWIELNDHIKNNYNVKKEINYFGKNYGWCIKFKKTSKTFCVLFPEQNSFTFLIVLGRKELEKINEMKSELSDEIINLIKNTYQYHDGKWVYIQLKDEKFLNDIKKIMKVK